MMLANKKLELNALCTGAIAGGLTSIYFGDNSSVDYYGINMSAPIATGVGCGIGSVVSDMTSEYVIKQLKINDQIMNGASLATKAAVGGAASTAILYFGGLPSESMSTAFLVGSASKIAGDYAN